MRSQGDAQVVGLWNEKVDATSAEDISHYRAYNAHDPADTVGILSVFLESDGASFTAALDRQIEYGIRYYLEADGVKDLSGNTCSTEINDFGIIATLAVSELEAEPDSISAGTSTVAVSFKIRNTGNYEAGPFRTSVSWKAGSADPVAVEALYYDGLAVGDSIEETLSIEVAPHVGSANSITVKADDLEQVDENNETSNTATIQLFTILPDLDFTSMDAEPDQLADAGEPVKIGYSLANTGNDGADQFRVTLWLKTVLGTESEEYPLGALEYPGLEAGSSISDSLNVIIPSSAEETNYIIARADDDSRIMESAEDNNWIELYLYSFMPKIASIRDVQGDGGGWVDLWFFRSGADSESEPDPVSAYEIYRRKEPSPVLPGMGPLEDWDLVGALEALKQSEYTVTVPTLADSSGTGTAWACFFVRALRPYENENPPDTVYYCSWADSGYSVDNLGSTATLLDCFHAEIRWPNVEIIWRLQEIEPEIGFIVARSDNGGPFADVDADIVKTGDASWFCLDAGVGPGMEYVYRIDYVEGGERHLLFETETLRTPAAGLTLYQNHPNPFNPSTWISYYLPESGKASLEIFDVAGRRVRTLLDGFLPAGMHKIEWNGRDDLGEGSASGIYFCKLKGVKGEKTVKMVLLR